MRRWLAAALVGFVVAIGTLVLFHSGSAPSIDAGMAPVAPVGAIGNLTLAPVRSSILSTENSATLDYNLGNAGSEPETFRISASELSMEGLPLPASHSSAAAWVHLATSTITVPARGSAHTPIVVRPPSDRGASQRRIGVTFTQVAPPGAAVSIRTAVTTSIYVQGIGPVRRDLSLADLHLPALASGSLRVSATLSNHGTVVEIPGTAQTVVAGSVTGGARFSFSGPLIEPGQHAVVESGRVSMPALCWCEVRVSVPDGRGGVSTLRAHVLVLPWAWIGGLMAILAGGALAVFLVRRFGGRTVAVIIVILGLLILDGNHARAHAANAPSPAGGTTTVTARVTTGSSDHADLPETGGPSLGLLASGFGALAAGTVLIFSSRRRKPSW